MTQFTPREMEIINHRLAVPDALYEVLCDGESDELAATPYNDVWTECLRISGDMQLKSVETIVAELTPLREFLLRDAIEGNTFVAGIPRDMPECDGQRRAAVRFARTAVAKLRAAGFKCGDVPEL